MATEKNRLPGISSLERDLHNQYVRWNDILINGCRDPFVSDGLNMQKIRRRIIQVRRQIKRLYPLRDQPISLEYLLPPVVKEDFMARSNEIRENAQKTLWILRNSKDYVYIAQNFLLLTGKDKETEEYIQTILREIECFSEDIEKDDLLKLRRNETPDWILSGLKIAAAKVENLLVEKQTAIIIETNTNTR